MSTRLSSSSQKIDQEASVLMGQKQGIVTILGSDCERSKASSLRRTLSADMSSKKWLAENGFSPMMKKIASSEQISLSLSADSSSSSEEEEEEEYEPQGRGQFDIWSSIQAEKKKKEDDEKLQGQFDIWSSIVSKKAEDEDPSKPLPPPYIHPLVKRSASSLTKKSLEICTESLGSETGSEAFSSDPPSETGDSEEEKVVEDEQEQEEEEIKASQSCDGDDEFRTAKYHYAATSKRSSQQPRSFPPPLASLSQHDGASLRMQSRRDNGRLVLEAVSVPLQNQFIAERRDGRLVLTFVSSPSNEEAQNEEEEEEEEEEENNMEELEEEFGDYEEDEEGEEDTEEEEIEEENVKRTKELDIGIEIELPAPKLSNRVTNVHRLASMMKKPIGLSNRNPAWPHRKFNEVVKFEEEVAIAKSLPPRPPVARLIPTSCPPTGASTATAAAAAASLNAYEYYWRAKPTATAVITKQPPAALKNKFGVSKINNPMANDQQQQQHLVPFCKDHKRSFRFWEPPCIATS